MIAQSKISKLITAVCSSTYRYTLASRLRCQVPPLFRTLASEGYIMNIPRNTEVQEAFRGSELVEVVLKIVNVLSKSRSTV